MTEVIVIFRDDFGLRLPVGTLVDRLERCREIGMTFESENIWTGERHAVEKNFSIVPNYRFRGLLNSQEDFFSVSEIITNLLKPCSNGIARILISEKDRIPKPNEDKPANDKKKSSRT